MRSRQAFVIILTAGILPLTVSLFLAWLLLSRGEADPLRVIAVSAAAGAIVLALASAGIVTAVRSPRRAAAPDPAETPDETPAPPEDTPHRPEAAPPPGLTRLVAALAAEQRGSPGPALRRLMALAGEQREHRPVPVSVNAAVDVCVRAMGQAGRHEAAGLSFDPDPNAGGALLDPDAFHLMLVCLIDSAREASGPGGQVEVRTQSMGDEVLVAVRDDGPGLAGSDLERIFEPFSGIRPGSSGLGLAVCRRIAAAHGGELTAVNIHPHGLETAARIPRRLPG